MHDNKRFKKKKEKTQLSSLLEWMGMRADFVHEELFSTAIG